MSDFEDGLALLEGELDRSLEVFGSLSAADWRRPTTLAPIGEGQPAWTVLELASHHDLFMWLTTVLVEGPEKGQAAEVPPVVYVLAYTRAEGKTPKGVVSALADTFATALAEARKTPPHTIGPAHFGPMRVADFITTRVVESVVHGLDLTGALGRDCRTRRDHPHRRRLRRATGPTHRPRADRRSGRGPGPGPGRLGAHPPPRPQTPPARLNNSAEHRRQGATRGLDGHTHARTTREERSKK
jgi:hypothetical protein